VKSITIHNLDDSLETLIAQKAREKGLSLNKTVKLLLGQALGIQPGDHGNRRADFAEFSGLWSKTDQKQFEKKTEALRQVDAQDWR